MDGSFSMSARFFSWMITRYMARGCSFPPIRAQSNRVAPNFSDRAPKKKKRRMEGRTGRTRTSWRRGERGRAGGGGGGVHGLINRNQGCGSIILGCGTAQSSWRGSAVSGRGPACRDADVEEQEWRPEGAAAGCASVASSRTAGW
jgi:hypothetical protein